jgi:hypothetical protein
METESNNMLEGTRLLEVLANMAGEIEKLENLSKELANLNNRISSLEKRLNEEEKSMGIPGNTIDKDLELKDIKISDLESHLAILESPEYRENVILDWLNDMDQNSYYALGVRKGYMEEISQERQSLLGELKDPSPEVVLSQEKPEDLTGWAYSKTLNCYVKLEGGMEV